jgi:hypothetical protein
MKWTWEKSGFRPVESRPDTASPARNPDAIRRLLQLPDTAKTEIRFYEWAEGEPWRAIVLVAENVRIPDERIRLASRGSGWDVEVVTPNQFAELQRTAVLQFQMLIGVTPALAERLVDAGYFGYDELSVIEPELLRKLGGLDAIAAEQIIGQAEVEASRNNS